MNRLLTVLTLLSCTCTSLDLHAADWPMWRYDAGRTACSPEQLPTQLQLLWSRSFQQRKPAWEDPLNRDLLTYDRIFEPIVVDGRLFLGFNDQDKLVAFDANTGRTLWTSFAEGPVRLPAAAWEDRIYFCSDDGHLYCVDASDGTLRWKFRGGPGAQRAIGNLRLISAWPARGGPVVRNGTVYFAASIWPFMGTFIYALDAETGEVVWVNDGTSAQYIKQPHSAPSFAGVAPQGALVATEDTLLVPGGRSVPAVFERVDGTFRYFEIDDGNKGTGGSLVIANDDHFFVHTRGKGTEAFQISNGKKVGFTTGQPVLAQDVTFASEVEEGVPLIKAYGRDRELLWQIEADGSGDLIQAGDCLYAAGGQSITRICLPTGDTPAAIAGTRIELGGNVERLVAADGKLFAVTLDGTIHAFGAAPRVAPSPLADSSNPINTTGESRQLANEILQCGDATGFAYWYGADPKDLLEAVIAKSPFVQLAVIDEDRETINRLRQQWDTSGVYGRVTAHHTAPAEFAAPKYTGNVVVVSPATAADLSDVQLASLYESVRPYGGVMIVLREAVSSQLAKRLESLDLEQAEVEDKSFGVVVRRVGPLPGAADWTHQYGNIGNTLKSDDRRVKLPLGILWFGGSSNMDVLPRHGHGPPEQVIGGRLFVEGMNSLSARDVYTGRVLWKREFEDLGTSGVYYDSSYEDVPLDTKYNQLHIPGSNGRGTNFIATDDRIYLAVGSHCLVLDPATGQTIQKIEMPKAPDGKSEEWGYLGVYDDILLGGFGLAHYHSREPLALGFTLNPTKYKGDYGLKSLGLAASVSLIAFDRHSGQQLWKVDARHSFWHNGIVAGNGKIYCLDRYPKQVEDALKRRGREPAGDYRIVALDAKTGAVCWEVDNAISGTWLGYSASKDLLLEAGAASKDRLSDEATTGMAVYSGSDGQLRWRNTELKYTGPCVLHNDMILAGANAYTVSAGAFSIETGEQRMIDHPITCEKTPWALQRNYGCNYLVASENLLTFRSGAAGFYDLSQDSGVGNFGGFKSGCTSNLVVANGVLNAPDYTRTCSCAYQNQTSLALVHMPGLELWTNHTVAAFSEPNQSVRQMAINFGAPGDRRDDEGTLWTEYPVVAGDSPSVSVTLQPEGEVFRRHVSAVATENTLPWVLASGVKNIDEIRIGLVTTAPKPTKGKAKTTPSGRKDDQPLEPVRCKLTLLFSAPQLAGLSYSEFHVYVQDKLVFGNVKIDPSKTAAPAIVVKTLEDVIVDGELHIRLESLKGQTLISGLKLQRIDEEEG